VQNRFYVDAVTGQPHINNHHVEKDEVIEI